MPKTKHQQTYFSEADLDRAIDRAVQRTAAAYEKKIQSLEKENRLLNNVLSVYQDDKARKKAEKMTLATLFGIKKSGGRPRKHTMEEMIESLHEWDHYRTCYAKRKGVKSVSDKELIEYYVEKYEAKASGNPNLSEAKKREAVKLRRVEIKHFRQTTGIRIRKHKKRKTPA